MWLHHRSGGLRDGVPTQWDRELIADLAAERSALREAQVVGVRGPSAANQTRLLGNRFDMIAVTNPTRLRQGQHALIDHLGPRLLLWCARLKVETRDWLRFIP